MSAALHKRLRDAAPSARVLEASKVEELTRAHRAHTGALTNSTTRRSIGEDEPSAVRGWLRSLPIDQNAEAEAVWLFDNAGATLLVSELVAHYDRLWFPSADDVVVRAADRSWLLFFDHEEVLSFLAIDAVARKGEDIEVRGRVEKL